MKRNIPYGKNYTSGEYAKRLLWFFVRPLFRYSPRLLYSWRNFILRLFGAKIGHRVRIYPSASVMFPWNLSIGDNTEIGWEVKLYNLGRITIGSHTIVSQYAHLCAGNHDYESPGFTLLKEPITIGSGVWIASDVFIGPGVHVGNDSVVAARAVVVKNIPDHVVAAGHPAKVIKERH